MYAEMKMHPRASHKVYENGCVQFDYHGFEISIAADGEDVAVFGLPFSPMYFSQSSGLMDAILSAKEAIDSYVG